MSATILVFSSTVVVFVFDVGAEKCFNGKVLK